VPDAHAKAHADTHEDETRGRAFWSGVLSFGLVSIPVDLFPAHRGTGGSLRMLDKDGTPLARRYYCAADEKELEPSELIRGYDLGKGKGKSKLVVVTDEELEALAPKKSREIDLQRFVDQDSIDPLYFERGYFLVPGSESGKAYRLLSAVMELSRRAGIASFVMRDREYLVAIFSEGGLLRAETLRFAAEVRSSADIGLPKASKPDRRVIERVRRTVQGLEQTHWKSSELSDPREAVRKLAEQKYRRKQDVIEAGSKASASASEVGGQVIDLMEVLRKSLADSGLAPKASAKRPASKTGRRTTAQRKKAPARRRTAARRR
jgi:DNA end-binding protein Ku